MILPPLVRERALRAAGVFLALWPGIGYLVLLSYSFAFSRNDYPLPSAVCWALTILVSCSQMGEATLGVLYKNRRFDWGLRASVGLAVYLFLGGIAGAMHIVSTRVILGLVTLGPVLCAGFRSLHQPALLRRAHGDLRRAWLERPIVPWLLRFALIVGVLLSLYGAAAYTGFNKWDDNMAYRSFPQQFLDTGTLYEPFSFRRVGGYGGQSLLHAIVIAVADPDRLNVLDFGICLVITFGLALGYGFERRGMTRPAALLGAFLVLSIPYGPHNLGSEFSGVVFFLAMFRLCDSAAFRAGSTRANAIALGLLAAAACTLRQNYLAVVALTVVLVYLAFALSDRRTQLVAWTKKCLWVGVATGAFLVPWMIMSVASLGTFLYPASRGNLNPDFGMHGDVKLYDELHWGLTNMFAFKPIQTIGTIFVAGLLLPASRKNRVAHAALLASCASFALMMHFFRAFHDADSINRYYFSFTIATAVMITMKATDFAKIKGVAALARSIAPAALAVGSVGLQFVGTRDYLYKQYDGYVIALDNWDNPRPLTVEGPERQYERIQNSIPPGVPILVMLDHAYLLNGKRNRLFQFDHPGVIGPPPGQPCCEGPEGFAAYMLSKGVRYVAFQLGPSSVEYQRQLWVGRRATTVLESERGGFYKRQARFELEAFDTLEALEKTRRMLFHEGDIRVIDLAERTPSG